MRRYLAALSPLIFCLVVGCAGVTLGGDMGGSPVRDGLVALDPIDFVNELTRGADPATASIGGGTVTFSGGSAGTLGILPLYWDDLFAWDLSPDGVSTITFTDLDVRAIRLYFAHSGSMAATLTAENADGEMLDAINSFRASRLGDQNALLDIDGGGATIARLVIDVPAGATVAIDHMSLNVPE